MPRAVIDTNIWISALMKSPLTRPILEAFIQGKFTPIISPALLKELNDTLNKPEVAKLIRPDEAKELLSLIEEKSHKLKTAVKINLCRDPEDNFLIALMLKDKAPLVTLDKDLLVLKSKDLEILLPKEFLKNLG